jgi:hypothetical protein
MASLECILQATKNVEEEGWGWGVGGLNWDCKENEPFAFIALTSRMSAYITIVCGTSLQELHLNNIHSLSQKMLAIA